MTKFRLVVLFVAFAFLGWLGQKDGLDALWLAWLLVGLIFWFATHVVIKSRLNDWLRWTLATTTLVGLFACVTTIGIGSATLLLAACFAFIHVVATSTNWFPAPLPVDGGGPGAQGPCPPNTPQQPTIAPKRAIAPDGQRRWADR